MCISFAFEPNCAEVPIGLSDNKSAMIQAMAWHPKKRQQAIFQTNVDSPQFLTYVLPDLN